MSDERIKTGKNNTASDANQAGASANSQKKRSKLAVRVVSATVFIALLLVCVVIGRIALAILFAACIGISLFEELKVVKQANHAPVYWVSYAGLLGIIVSVFTKQTRFTLPFLAFLAICALFCVIYRKDPQLTDWLFSILPFLTIILPGACVFGMLTAESSFVCNYLSIMMIGIAISSDTFAYFVGSTVRGPKLCPAISPKKTISGSIGGMLGSILGAFVVTLCFRKFSPSDIVFPPMWAVLLCGILAGVLSQMGDLLASMVKRTCNVKDFGNLIPGHGGMLDRIDSILLCSIIIFGYRMLFFA